MKTYLFMLNSPDPANPGGYVREFRAVTAETTEAARAVSGCGHDWECVSASPTVASFTFYQAAP